MGKLTVEQKHEARYVNIQSLRNKLHRLENYLKINPNVDVFGISELWLSEPEMPLYNIVGYTILCWRTRAGAYGGVLFYVRQQVIAKYCPDLQKIFQDRDFKLGA